MKGIDIGETIKVIATLAHSYNDHCLDRIGEVVEIDNEAKNLTIGVQFAEFNWTYWFAPSQLEVL